MDTEGSQEIQRDFRQKVSELIEVGLESPDIYAYHGASIEALIYLAENGTLPGEGSYEGEFYFAPLDAEEREAQLQHAKSYAVWNAMKYYCLNRLPYKPTDMKSFMDLIADPYPLEGEDDDGVRAVFKEAEDNGVNYNKFMDLIKEAIDSRKGVVFTISSQLSKDFKVEPGSGYDEKKILLKGGLPLKYITGIEPQGDYEWDKAYEIQENTP